MNGMLLTGLKFLNMKAKLLNTGMTSAYFKYPERDISEGEIYHLCDSGSQDIKTRFQQWEWGPINNRHWKTLHTSSTDSVGK